MSILNNFYNVEQYSNPDLEVLKLKADAKKSFEQLHFTIKRATERFWKNPNYTPQEMALAAGTDAKELFELHSMIVSVLENANPGSCNDIISMVGDYTVNPDGTVTIL